MTDVISLNNDYIKDFIAHLAEDKTSVSISNTSNKSLYEDIKNFYSNKKSNLFILKDNRTNQYQGHFIVKFNKLEENELAKHIKPCKNLYAEDTDGYFSLGKLSVKKDLHSEENIFQNSYIGVFEKLDSLNVPQIVINSKSNETFDMLCKFCNGKMIDSKDSINYIIPVDVEKVKQAFSEMNRRNINYKRESIGEILVAIKQKLESQKPINPITKDSQNQEPTKIAFTSAINRLNEFNAISRR